MAAPAELNAAERTEAMGRRVLTTLQAGLIAPGTAELVHRAYLIAARPRSDRLSAADTRLLHPGRTVLILWQDCGVRIGAELAAAALVETADLEFRVDLTGFEAPAVAALAQSIPVPAIAQDRLLEDLLALESGAARIAVAERLDRARHMHLREAALRRDEFELIQDVYLPLAHRTDPLLARRLARWAEVFEQRYLGN